MTLSIAVNGTAHPLPEDTRTSLLDFLRDGVGLTGTKKGCDHGQCGAFTVMVSGTRINIDLMKLQVETPSLPGRSVARCASS